MTVGISRLFLLGIEKVGSIKSCRLEHYNRSASSRARLISCCRVRLFIFSNGKPTNTNSCFLQNNYTSELKRLFKGRQVRKQ